MHQSVKPMTAFVIVAVFALLLGGKFWAYGEAMSVRVFTFMHQHPNGNAYIALGNQLYGFDQQGQATESIDLKKFDADENLQSDFAFFSNGDLLFRPRVAENSNTQNFINISNFNTIYSQYDLVHYFYPFLKQGRYIDKDRMNSLLMRNNLYLYSVIAVIIAIIGYFIYLSIKSF